MNPVSVCLCDLRCFGFAPRKIIAPGYKKSKFRRLETGVVTKSEGSESRVDLAFIFLTRVIFNSPESQVQVIVLIVRFRFRVLVTTLFTVLLGVMWTIY